MTYDLVVVGGGLAGSSVGTALARAGASVLVLEQETRFRDRVRGEAMHPWGVADARALGLLDSLLASCAREVPGWTYNFAGGPPRRRDLPGSTPHQAGAVCFYHPEMQETLLSSAEAAGATVRRGARVLGVQAGARPHVTVQSDGRTEEIAARLVAGADGRHSQVRAWADFTVQRDPDRTLVSGILFHNMEIPEDSVHLYFPAEFGSFSILFPVGQRRVRAYFTTDQRERYSRMSGIGDVPAFIERSAECGLPASWFASASVAGPLATFEGAAHWVNRPAKDGVVLVGDAAAASDPTWGCGQSLAVRDARMLRDALLAEDDWTVAARHYAEAHDETWMAIHKMEHWMTEIFFRSGVAGDRLRAHAIPVLFQRQGIDIVGLGPDGPSDEAVCARLFGEEPVTVPTSSR